MNISILGCGWLGFPLAKQLLKLGHTVTGSTTSPGNVNRFLAAGIQPILLKLPAPESDISRLEDFFSADVLLVAIPPAIHKQGTDFHLNQLESIEVLLPKPKQLIYISSTSVYPKQAGTYAEAYHLTKKNTGNSTLFKAETLLKALRPDCTIVRMGGLMGDDRIPGKRNPGALPPQPKSPVNFIHLDDATGLLAFLIENNITAELINGVAPYHPTRISVYEAAARKAGYPLPKINKGENLEDEHRIIDSEYLIATLEYSFKQPNPQKFTYSKPNS